MFGNQNSNTPSFGFGQNTNSIPLPSTNTTPIFGQPQNQFGQTTTFNQTSNQGFQAKPFGVTSPFGNTNSTSMNTSIGPFQQNQTNGNFGQNQSNQQNGGLFGNTQNQNMFQPQTNQQSNTNQFNTNTVSPFGQKPLTMGFGSSLNQNPPQNNMSFGINQVQKSLFGQTQVGTQQNQQTNQNIFSQPDTSKAFNFGQNNNQNQTPFGQQNQQLGFNNTNTFSTNTTNQNFLNQTPQTNTTFGTSFNTTPTFGNTNQFGNVTNTFGTTNNQGTTTPFGLTNNFGTTTTPGNLNAFGQLNKNQFSGTLGTPAFNQGNQQQGQQMNSVNLQCTQIKNAKNQLINSITYLSELKGTNLSLIRLGDYNLMKGKSLPQNIQTNFENYLQRNGNSNTQQGNQNLNVGGIFSQPNTQSNFGTQNQLSNNLLQSNVITNQPIALGPQPTQTPSLLGQTPGNQGLFGQTTQAQTNPGLNLGQQNTMGGLFGTNKPNVTTSQFNSGNLFGQQSQTTTPFGSGLTQNKPTGGLFSTDTNSSNTGLFGNTSNNTQPFGSTTNSGNLFGQTTTPQMQTNTPFLSNSTNNTQPLFGTSTLNINQPSSGLFGQTSNTQSTPLFGSAPQTQSNNLFNISSNQAPQQQGQSLLPQYQSSSINNQILQQLENTNNPFMVFFVPVKNQDANEITQKYIPKDNHQLKDLFQPQQDTRQPLSYSYVSPQLKGPSQKSLMQRYEQAKKSLFVKFQNDNRREQRNRGFTNQYRTNQIFNQNFTIIKTEEPFFITVILDKGTKKNIEIKMKIDKEKMVAHILRLLLEQYLIEEDQILNSQVYFEDEQLHQFYNFSDYPQIVNGSIIQVKINQDSPISKILAPKELLPKLGNLKTVPSFQQLARMTELQLSSVKDFQVFNEFGKIQFKVPVDLRKLDLTKIIEIQNKKIEIYPQSNFTQEEKPPIGKELNQPVYLEFYNMKPDSKHSIKSYQTKLEKMVQIMNGEFIYYDPQQFRLKFSVQHF